MVAQVRGELGAELEAALVRELRSTWDDLNAAFFKRKLRPVPIELSAAPGRLGRWRGDVRCIEIDRKLVVERPWGVVVEVLKHEMAHQYVAEVLGQPPEGPHGPAFRDVCKRLQIDPAATGLPDDAPPPAQERALERIARLLALAESQNAHEAQAAMSAAQRLMLKYNLDEASARTQRDYGFRHLGRPSGRVTEAERLVAAILAEHFFVEVIWVPVYRALEGKRGSVLEICGTPANLEMASYVHAFLHQSAAHLWSEHKRAANIRGDRDRRTFLAGVMHGFLEKLEKQKRANREEGLVWLRDADLSGFYRARHPHIRHASYTGSRRTAAHEHGREAGRNLVLHRPVQSAATSAGRLLGSGR